MKTFLQKIKLMVPAATALVAPASAKAIDITNWGLTVKEDAGVFDTVQIAIEIFLFIAGIIAVIYLIYGGVQYLTAGGDAEKAGAGKTTIIHAIIGIVIIVVAYGIFSYVLSALGLTPGTLTPIPALE